MSSIGDKTNSSLPKKSQPFTARGRELNQKFFTNSANNTRPTVKGRNRSNSLRRLNAPTLESLKNSQDQLISTAAQRELDVRHELVNISQQQQSSSPVRMNAKQSITLQEASSLRFSSSLAEEAQDEIHNEQTSQEKEQLGQIGIANVKGTLGLGFSGRKEQEPFINKVQQRMLAIQEHYQKINATSDWSSKLIPTSIPNITSDANICAATRANAAARSARNEFSGMDQVDRSDIPTPDRLVEMTSRATHPTGGRLKQFEAQKLQADRYKPDYQTQSMARRNRNGSVSNMTHSCKTCSEERLKFVGE